jgi:Ca2+-binding RTX toxin-like protein
MTTYTGTPGNDLLTGGVGDDLFLASGGSDRFTGGPLDTGLRVTCRPMLTCARRGSTC